MKTVTLFTKLYGQYKNRMAEAVKSNISSLTGNIDVHLIHFETDKRGHIVIRMDGQDSEFAINYLMKEYGKSLTLENVTEGAILRGLLIDVGKVGYGLYVDIAVMSDKKPVDALIPLYRIREQFRVNKPLRTLAKSLVLVDNLPVDILITHVDSSEGKLEATFAESTMNRFDEWLNDDHERLLVFGANLSMIENALTNSGHIDDIYQINELGKFEYALRCKRSTRASGILAAVGPMLKGIPMHLFIPKEVKTKMNMEI